MPKPAKFSLARYIYHEGIAALFAVLAIIFFDVPANVIPAFMLFALAGGIAPNIDEWMGIGHRNPLLHSFLLPFLVWLITPRSIVFTAFTVGYLAHLVSDTAKSKQYWVIIDNRVGVALLWASIVLLGGMLLGWNPMAAYFS